MQQIPAQNPIPKQITEGLINPFGLVCMCVLVFHLVTNTSAFSVLCTSGIQQKLKPYIQFRCSTFFFHYFRMKRLEGHSFLLWPTQFGRHRERERESTESRGPNRNYSWVIHCAKDFPVSCWRMIKCRLGQAGGTPAQGKSGSLKMHSVEVNTYVKRIPGTFCVSSKLSLNAKKSRQSRVTNFHPIYCY